MQGEYHSILTIQTRTLEDLFHGKCAITFHWVYKKNPNGEPTRGNSQEGSHD
jgi:hypothetical protein